MSLYFDPKYYLEQNPDVAAAVAQGVMTAEEHWALYGSKEGRNPNATFDVSYYLGLYPDVAASDMNPLEHFVQYGAAEGRAPSAAYVQIAAKFDEQNYLDANPDVAQAVAAGNLESGYHHWVLYGQFENERPAATYDGGKPIKESLGQTVFTLTEIPTQREATLDINDVDADLLLAFLQDFTDLDLAGLGLLDENGNLVGVENINVTDNTASNTADTDGSASININLGNGEQISAFAENYLALIADIIATHAKEGEVVTQTGIVLTPKENNGGAFENGFTTNADDLIVAGRPELLHGAYIDGGLGYNTLEVDMKGFFAQPFQLLNIQEVQIQNLANVYNVNQTIIDGAIANFPIPDGAHLTGADSVIDLSRARDLEKLVITEGFNVSGGLVVAGIQNYATARLEGNFDGDVDLFYGRGQGDELTLELANVSFDGAFSVNQNVGAVTLVSEGRVNTLDNVDFGGNFVELTVTGSGMLSIEDDLQFGFGEAVIDASANTGGVRLKVDSQTGFGALEEITITGSQGRDVFDINSAASNGVLLNIDTGVGRDTIKINAPLSAGQGSVITGDNLTVAVNAAADLREADISGVDSFVLAATGGLLLTQAQVAAAGAGTFVAAHGDQPVLSIEVSEAGTVLSDLIDLSALDSDVKLAFNVKAGASLELTAEELHTYLADDGVVGQGTVTVTDAGLGFDAKNPDANGIGEGEGSIDHAFEGTLNVIRAADGFERPVAAADTDQLVIDTTDTGGVTVDANDLATQNDNADAFSTAAKTVVIEGADDITFNVPVEMLTADFTLDFSGLTGALNGLTIEQFNNVAEIIGNGAADLRINVELDGDVGAAGPANGLQSSGVAQYVVTDLNGADRTFNVCDSTQDVEVLGRQGSGYELTFTNIPWGSVNPTILFEGDGFGNWDELPKAAGNPDASNVGTIVAEYFHPGAPANVLITNQGVAPGQTSTGEARPIVVDGIQVGNAASLNITAEDGNTVISDITDNGPGLEDVTLTSAFDVQLDLDSGNSGLNIDADGVAGTATLFIEDGSVDLSDGELSGIDAVVLEDSSGLTLTIDQIEAIGAANISVENEGDTASLNVGNYDGQAFDFGALAQEGIDVGIVTVLEGADVTVDPATDFTNVNKLVIPAGSNVTLTAAQFKQLVESGAKISTGAATVTLEAGSLTVDMDGDLTIGQADLDAITDGGTRANVIFDAADGETLNVELLELANGLQVTGDEAAAIKPLVNFLFNDADGNPNTSFSFSDVIDVLNYQGVDVRIKDELLDNFEIGGNNSQSIEDLLANLESANILNIFRDIVDVEESPRDRSVVVEPEATPTGIEFSAEGNLADYLRSTELTLQANADNAATVNGDIIVNDLRAEAGYTMLTINAEDVDGAAVGAVTINGDIKTEDAQAGSEGELTEVTINAGHALNITGTIVFNAIDAGPEATLTVTGDADVSIKALDTTDADITGLTVDTTGYTGTLTITGGSDALEIDNTESLVFVGSGDVVLDTDDGAGNNGIDGDALTSVDASGLTGSLTVGVIESVDSENFTFTGAQGATTLTLGGGVVLNADATDPAQPGWTFNLNAGDTLTITEGATFTSGALSVTGGTIVIDGDVDFRGLVDADGNSLLDFSGASVELADGATVAMTDAQFAAFEAAGGTIAGNTVLEVTQEFIDANGDNLTELRGFTEIHVDNGLSVGMTGEQALITQVKDANGDLGAAGELAEATIDVQVAADIDLTAVSGMNSLELLDTDGDATTSLTVQLSAEEASQLAGSVTRNNNDDTIEVTYSGDAINPTGVAAADATDLDDLATFNLAEVDRLTLDGDTTLSVEQLGEVLGAENDGEFEGEIVKNGNALNVVLASEVAGNTLDLTTVGDLVDTLDIVNGIGVDLTLSVDQAANAAVWNDDPNSNPNPYLDENAVEGDAGDFTDYTSSVRVIITADADVSGLQGVDSFDLPADTDAAELNDVALTINAEQTGLLSTTADVDSAGDILAQLSELTITGVEYDNANFDGTFTETVDVTLTADASGAFSVSSNAGALAALQADGSGLLGAVDNVTFESTGTVASMINGDLDAGGALVSSTFEFSQGAATSAENASDSVVITNFQFGDGTGSDGNFDVLDFTAFLGEGYTAQNSAASAIENDSVDEVDVNGEVVFFDKATVEVSDFANNAEFADFNGQAVVVTNDGGVWYVDSAGAGAVGSVDHAGDIQLVGTVNSAYTGMVEENVTIA